MNMAAYAALLLNFCIVHFTIHSFCSVSSIIFIYTYLAFNNRDVSLANLKNRIPFNIVFVNTGNFKNKRIIVVYGF